MIDVDISLSSGSVTLQKAMLMYGTSASHLTVMSSHDIEILDGKPVIKEGMISRTSSLVDVAHSILNTRRSGLRFIPSDVLALDEDQFVWWVPAGPQRMFFRTREKGLENSSGTVANPACVFARTSNDWYVFALASNERPSADTELLVSPYFNVWDDHRICVGSTAVPKDQNAQAWTKAFFASAFTHTNYRSKKTALSRRGDRAALWRDLLEGKLKTFPIRSLPKAGIRLGEFIEMAHRND